jgi:hypothetical protein
MNERHVATIKATLPRRKEDTNKSVWIWRLLFRFYLLSLKRIEVVFFVCLEIWALWGFHSMIVDNATQHKRERVLTTTTFIFDFSHYQSWKSRKVVFFQMLEMSSFVIMWWRNEECGRRDTTCDMSESTHDDDNNDNDTTTINSQWFTKLKYNNCLLLLACLMSFIDLSFLCHFSIHLVRCSTFNSQYDSTIK